MKSTPYLSLADYFARSGRSRSDAAKSWQVTEATISRWINGTRQPQAAHALMVAADTGIPLDALLRASVDTVA